MLNVQRRKNKIEAFLSIFDNSVYNQISPPYIKVYCNNSVLFCDYKQNMMKNKWRNYTKSWRGSGVTSLQTLRKINLYMENVEKCRFKKKLWSVSPEPLMLEHYMNYVFIRNTVLSNFEVLKNALHKNSNGHLKQWKNTLRSIRVVYYL